MGYWGKNLVRNFHEIGALSAICDSSSAVEELCKKYPGVSYRNDYDTVLRDSNIVAIAIATPAVMHYDMARCAIEAGKDVFVEKPLSISVAEGEELIALAVEKKRVLMVGHILRYHPAVVKLQELIKGGALGRIQYLYSNRLNIGKIRTEENILWSFAPHDISVMLALLGEEPVAISCQGGAYLNQDVADVTVSQFVFPSGVRGHIHVSWLHPFKEQRLVVIGSEKMAVFDDTAEHKLVLYPHKVEWKNRVPTAVKADPEVVAIDPAEPLRVECEHFLQCVETRKQPLTDGVEGLRVLRVLDAGQRSLEKGGIVVSLPAGVDVCPYFAHESAFVDQGAEVGAGTKIWHFAHIMKGAKIGRGCILGQNVNVAGGAVIGNNVKIQNNVSVYTGAVIEDDVFLGPSCVLTNITNPRAQISRHSLYEKTVFRRGCTIGANSTIICGITVGRYAFVGIGSVVTRDIPDYALAVGDPARQCGWMSRHGQRLPKPDRKGVMVCPESGYRYKEVSKGILRCMDLDEEAPLPAEKAKSVRRYDEFKSGSKRLNKTQGKEVR
jgi:UDP-2-acetamido-3-amino-2,3-dideoxy-glucuronate N-acetyltransferase